MAMYAIYDLTNCSTSAAIKTCCQDRPYITPPGTITYKSPDPSFIFVAHGRTKKTSDELFEQFKPKPPARKSRKVIHLDPDAVSKRTRSNVRPVSSRTRSKETNPPIISTRRTTVPKRSAPCPIERETLIELHIEVEVDQRKVAQPRSQKRTEQSGDVDETESTLDEIDKVTQERTDNSVGAWDEFFRSKRLQAEADQKEQDLQRKKEEEEQDRLKQEEKEERDKKSKEQKDQWAKIFAKKRNKKGGKRKTRKDELDKMNEKELLEWSKKMQAEYEKGEKYHFEHELSNEERRQFEPATFTYDEQGRRIPKKLKKKKKKQKQTISTDFIKGWIFYTILFCWSTWRYRSKIALCLLLWHCYCGYFKLKKSM